MEDLDDSRRFNPNAVCANCGERWGLHVGRYCDRVEGGVFVQLATEGSASREYLIAKLRSWHLANAGNGMNGEFFGKVADELELLRNDAKVLQEMTTLLVEGSSAIAKLSASPAVAHLCMRLRAAEKAESDYTRLLETHRESAEEGNRQREAITALESLVPHPGDGTCDRCGSAPARVFSICEGCADDDTYNELVVSGIRTERDQLRAELHEATDALTLMTEQRDDATALLKSAQTRECDHCVMTMRGPSRLKFDNPPTGEVGCELEDGSGIGRNEALIWLDGRESGRESMSEEVVRIAESRMLGSADRFSAIQELIAEISAIPIKEGE